MADDLPSSGGDQQVSDSQRELAERGYPLPPPGVEGEGLPAGGSLWVVPHFQSFSQIANLVSRSYRWTFDEALRHSYTHARAFRRDPVMMEALRARQMPVAELPWHLEARNDNSRVEQRGVKLLTEIIQDCPRFLHLKMHLLESIWYGRYGVQVKYGWDWSRGNRRMVVVDHLPINGDKLVFRYSGEVGQLVHSTYPGKREYTDRGLAHFYTPRERENLIVHTHDPEDLDFFEGDKAGAVRGMGIRDRLYWFMYMRARVFGWLMDFLQRVGAGGLTVYFYEAGSNESLQEVKKAAELQQENNSILFPRYRADGSAGPGIQRFEPSQGGASVLQVLITDYFDTVIRRFILGQSLSAEAAGTGLGSGVSEFHQMTLNRLLKFDATGLQETLTRDFVRVLAKYNCPPGMPCPRFVFDVDRPNAAEILEAAERFYQMGGSIDEDSLRSVLGLPKPKPGSAILSRVDTMSPEAVGSLPEGVPIMGQPGPDPRAAAGQQQPQQMRRRGAPVRYFLPERKVVRNARRPRPEKDAVLGGRPAAPGQRQPPRPAQRRHLRPALAGRAR
jgi:hypothetical protein